MPSVDRALGMYLQLARAAGVRGQAGIRDKLLILAGVTANELDHDDVAAQCRQRILEHNPQHLIRRWPSFAEALADDEFLVYLKQQLRRYSAERVEHLLAQLGVEPFSGEDFSLRDDTFRRLLAELDAADPADEELDALTAQRLLNAGGYSFGRKRSFTPPRRYNRAQPFPTLWLVVALGAIACTIYIALALFGQP